MSYLDDVEAILDMIKESDIKITSYGFNYEKGSETSDEECKKLDEAMSELNDLQIEQLKRELGLK